MLALNKFIVVLLFTTFHNGIHQSFGQRTNTPRHERYKVVIIGAGAAGIAAASKLVQNNVTDFIILEARGRIGGRIHTVYHNGVIDLGAQYIHGEDGNAVFEVVKDYDVYKRSGDSNGFEIYSPGQKLFGGSMGEKLWKTIQEIIDVGSRPPINVTLRNYFIPRFTSELIKLNMNPYEIEIATNIMEKIEAIRNAGDLDEMGPQGYFEYEETPGDIGIEWKNGYVTFLNILMGIHPGQCHDLGIKEKILLNKEVNNIQWSDIGVRVQTTDGSIYNGDHVIITLPLGVLKNIPQNFFQPALPNYKHEAIKAFGFGTIAKIFLTFDERWWTNLTNGFAFGMTQNDITNYKSTSKYGEWSTNLTGFDPMEKMPFTLLSWTFGKAAKEMELLSDNDVMKACHEMLQFILGKNVWIPQPRSVIRTKWFRDPYSRGSYSFSSVESDLKKLTRHHLAMPIQDSRGKPVVLFAGEATHLKHFSTVHGAVETGRREAERLLRYL